MLRAVLVVLCGRTAYATEVESSLTFTVGTSSYAAGTNGHLYVKLLSGTTPIPMSSTVSAPAYSGPCSVTDQDSILDDWSGDSGWLKLDDIDVSARGITSSQSLGSLDPTLPLTHIEFYSTSADGMRIGDVIIQVGDTSYGLPAGWNSYANYALLETDSCPDWWMEIEMRFLSSPAPTIAPTTGTGYIFQAGRCYPESGAPLINTGGGMANDVSDDFRETASPQLCYNYCAANTMGNHYMGLDLRSTGGQDCVCNRPGGHTIFNFGWSRLDDQGSIRTQANQPRTTTTMTAGGCVSDPL